MDYDYWLRLGKAGVKFRYLQEKLAGSRLYGDNKTLSARVNVHKEINYMFKRKFGRVPDCWLINYSHVLVQDYFPRKHLIPKAFFWVCSAYGLHFFGIIASP